MAYSSFFFSELKFYGYTFFKNLLFPPGISNFKVGKQVSEQKYEREGVLDCFRDWSRFRSCQASNLKELYAIFFKI